MSEIKLRAEDARGYAEHIQKEAGTAKEQMDALRNYLNNLSDAFTGQAATAFDGTFNDWKAGADQMLDGLDQLGQFLRQAADVLEDTDSQIAGQLGN